MRGLWVVVLVGLVGCGKKAEAPAEAEQPAAAETPAEKPAAKPAETFPGTEAGAKALLQRFLDPTQDVEKLSATLRPQAGDYAKVFAGESAAKAQAAYGPAWDAGAMQIKPKAGQTELLLWSASSEDVKAWTGAAKEHFPGGYEKVGQHLNPGLTLYRFKFVEPGKTLGMAFDGLVHVDGRWVIFPKPWRALGL